MSKLWRRYGGSLALASLVELMLFFPVVLGAFILKPPGTLNLAVVLVFLLAGYWIGYGLNALLKFRHPFPRILLGIVVSAVAGVPLLGVSVWSIVLMLLVLVAVYRGSRLPGLPLAARLATQDYIVGVFLYFAGSILHSINHTFDDYRLLYLAAGLLTLFSALFLTNRGMVGRETLSGTERPMVEPTVRRNNRIFVSAAIGVTVLIALSYQLQALLGNAGHAVADWLSRLFSNHGGQQQEATQQEVQPPPQMPGMGKSKTLPAWVDYIMYGIAIAFVLVLLYLLARRLNRLPGWLVALREKFARLFQRDKGVAARGYVDEIERIKKNEKPFRRLFGRSKEERLKWKELTDNESRIRYLYRRWIGNAVKKGFAHQSHLTPQEIRRKLSETNPEQMLSPADADALVQHYQQVRYGGGKLSDEQVQALAAKLGQAKP